jgi:hypothetical protein
VVIGGTLLGINWALGYGVDVCEGLVGSGGSAEFSRRMVD